jgi:hypothetical protein
MIVLDDYSKVFNGRVVLGEFLVNDVGIDRYLVSPEINALVSKMFFYVNNSVSSNFIYTQKEYLLPFNSGYFNFMYSEINLFNNKTKEKIIN